MPSVRIEVTGDVQGVGFRAFVCRRAALFGVSGQVWNRMDGNVEVLATHIEASALEVFAESLQSGPGQVTKVTSISVPDPEIEPLGFSIGPTV